MKPLAKPTGTLLDEHIFNLLEEVKKVVAARPFVCRKYQEMVGRPLEQEVKLSSRWHDEGKKDNIWQTACQLDYQEFLKSGKVGSNLKKTGVRHELVSLELIEQAKANVSLPVKVAVAAHHSKLSYKYYDRWLDRKEFKKFWDEFVAKSSSFRSSDRSALEKAIRLRYEFAGPRALLQLVDHRASAFEKNEPLPKLNGFSYKFPYKEKRGVQKLIEELWDNPFAILRAPTGSGKTDAALLWAEHQIEAGRADRLIIAMPTRFTANALHISKAEDLGSSGLYHSSAWYQRIKDKENISWHEKIFIDKEQGLARKLESPVTVTTIDHLCICLSATREDHHAIFFNLAHSCVVIDEADFYDDFTQYNILVLLTALRLLKVPVLLMSATIPESTKNLYEKSGFSVPIIYEEKNNYERPRCVIKRCGSIEQPDDIADLLERGLKGESIIIYANTVRSAQTYYQWFKKNNCKNLVLYHSRFTEPDKANIETKLISLLGSEAWKNGKPQAVVILTQIGEISANISADIIISELCPVDRLAQRVGRGSRFEQRYDGKKGVIAEIFIVNPYKLNKKTGDKALYPAPYGSYNFQSGWEPSKALILSNELLREGEYSAKTLIELVNNTYSNIEKELPHVRINRKALESCITTNWLILPAETVENDDENTKDWRSRDIPPQQTIFANYKAISLLEDNNLLENNKSYFRNMTERREFEIRYSIKCYNYEFNAMVKQSLLEKEVFTIGEETTEELWLIKPEFYNSEVGLHFGET